jgi:MoxR-like ATPase
MVRVSVGYPSPDDEARIILDRVRRQSQDTVVDPVVDADGLRSLQAAVERIHVDEDVARYCVELARATREAANVAVGASPRGSQSLVLLGRALAALDGRDYVRPDDVKRIAGPVLAHRLTLTPQAWAQGVDPHGVVAAVVARVAVPPTVSTPR